MAILLLASKWDALADWLKDASNLVELANLLRQGDAGMWTLLGVVSLAILAFALRSWHRADLVLEKAIVRWTTLILAFGLLIFVGAVCIQSWIWIEQSAWPLRARVAPISHLSFNATANMRMGQWHGDAIELKNTTSKKMHIKHVVVNGEHELKFRIDVLNRIVPAGLVTIEPNSSATWYLRGDPPFRPWLDIPVWFPIPMHRSRGAESSDVEAEVQKERERRAAEARAKAAQTRQQQLDEDLRVAASAFRNSVTSVDIDVNGKTIHLKVQDRP
jgi:hypothetical protein